MTGYLDHDVHYCSRLLQCPSRGSDAAVLFGGTDLREFKIRNELVLVLGDSSSYTQAYLDAGSNFIGTSDLPFSRSY